MKDENAYILLAEDDRNIAEIMKLILHEEGYTVRVAPNKHELEDLCREQLPRLIFLDIRLGGEDGEAIATELRQDTTTSNIPLIMLSADDRTVDIAERVGADGFLLKPFELSALVDIVKKHFA